MVAPREVILTADHLALVMDYAAGGNLTAYVTSKWPKGPANKTLFLSEDEARYFFRVRPGCPHSMISKGPLSPRHLFVWVSVPPQGLQTPEIE